MVDDERGTEEGHRPPPGPDPDEPGRQGDAPSPEKDEPPETSRHPSPGVKHEPEPDAENIIPAEDEPGTF